MFRINMYKIYAGLIAIVLLTSQAQAMRLFCCGSKKPVVPDTILEKEKVSVANKETDLAQQKLQLIRKKIAQELMQQKPQLTEGL